MKRQIDENEEERLKVQEMVAKAKVRATVFEECESGDRKLCPEAEEVRPKKQMQIITCKEEIIKKQKLDEHLTPKKTGIAEVLCNLVKQKLVPNVDLGMFDGNPL